MFEIYCPTHRSAVLLSTSRIDRIHSTHHGVVVEWRCWCGQPGRTVGGRVAGPTRLPEAS
jgi:hypothetical protein